jgi:hypothetical protein
VAFGPVWDLDRALEAALLVEAGRLEIVAHHERLLAPAPARLGERRVEQRQAQPLGRLYILQTYTAMLV